MEEKKTKEEQVAELIRKAGTQLDGFESYLKDVWRLIEDEVTIEQRRPYTALMVHIGDLRQDLEWLSDETT